MLQQLHLPRVDRWYPLLPLIRQSLQYHFQNIHPPLRSTLRHILYRFRLHLRAEDAHPVTVKPYEVRDDHLTKIRVAFAEEKEWWVVWRKEEGTRQGCVDFDDLLEVFVVLQQMYGGR